LSFLSKIFGRKDDRAPLRPLYGALVGAARDPMWYRDGGVPDTIDGRFDMIAALFALLLLRLEREGDAARAESVLLTELLIDDMEGSIRQLGTGDLVVGKRIGKMMGGLGGRMAALREQLGSRNGLDDFVARNIFHDAPAGAVTFLGGRLERFHAGLEALSLDDILGGRVPAL
jgi:cytochrome b pre-mRNA-processing protein 3